MIPTLIVLGSIVGRWWLVAIVAIAWPVLLITMKIGTGFIFGLETSIIASANTVAGVVLHRAVTRALHRLRNRSAG